jgi:hypothetical protein
LRHFIYYIDRRIELDGDSHGPKGRELLEDLIAKVPHRGEHAVHAACSAIKAWIGRWNGTLSKLRYSRGIGGSDEREWPDDWRAGAAMAGRIARSPEPGGPIHATVTHFPGIEIVR